jgi:hypothetical protein
MLNTISGLLGGGAPPTDYESIQTITVGSGGQASVTFSSIPSTYTHLQIRAIARTSSAGYGRLRFNGDTGSNYNRHAVYGTGSAAASTAASDAGYWGDIPNTASMFQGTVIDILDYTNTNKNTTVRCLTGYDTNGAGVIQLWSSLWRNTAAVTSVTLDDFFASNLQEYSSFALYGIK